MREQIHQVFNKVRSSLRFRWYGLTIAWTVALIGWIFVSSLPDVYEGRARFYVDTSSVLEPVLGNQFVEQNIARQMGYVREALLSRERLENVIQTTGFDENIRTAAGLELAIQSLLLTIDIQSIVPNGDGDSIYTLTYRSPDREKAVGVVRSLLDSFAADTRGVTQVGGETAQQFLDERVLEYEHRLQRAEEALAEFKRRNADRLPGAEGDYFQRMQSERDQLAAARRELRILESRRDQIVQQLSGQASVVSGVNPASTVNEPPANSLDARIRDYQARLDSMLLDYTDRHPDVIAVREALAQLTRQRDEQLAALGIDATDQELHRLGANPVHQALQISLNEAEINLATLRADIADRTARVSNLQSLIEEVPEVEAQLARLNRDYEVVYDQYLSIVRSREAQQLTRKASDADEIEVRIIDPPLASSLPVGPPRLLLLAGVYLASFLLGGAACYFLAELKPVFGNVRVLNQISGLPVLGAISEAWDERRRQEIRRSTLQFSAAIAGLTAVFVVIVGLELTGLGISKILGSMS